MEDSVLDWCWSAIVMGLLWDNYILESQSGILSSKNLNRTDGSFRELAKMMIGRDCPTMTCPNALGQKVAMSARAVCLV